MLCLVFLGCLFLDILIISWLIINRVDKYTAAEMVLSAGSLGKPILNITC